MKFWATSTAWLLLAVTTSVATAQDETASSPGAGTGNATAAAAANAELQAAQALLASMPDCGRNCLLASIAASPCDVTDIACSCSNATITAEVEICITSSCTIRQSLSSQNATMTLCQAPIRDDTKAVSYAGVIGGILAVLAYVLRMLSRLPRFGGSLGWDDLAMTIAVLEVIPLSILSVILANLGLGKDIWTVPFENITHILKIYYFDEDLYLTALPLVKVSMLLFYLRIFPQKWFRVSCWITIACCFGYGIAFMLVSVFQCRPISMAWNHWDGEHHGVCNDINAQGWTSAALNVLLDLVVVGLPMPVLAKLQLNKRKKLFVCLMFSVGAIVTIISILRLQVLAQFGGTSNFTWHYRSVGYWSTSETDLAVICGCMPGMRALVTSFIPKVMGDSTQGKSPGPSTAGNGTGQSAVSFDRKVRLSRTFRDPMKSEKDFIPLVEIRDYKTDSRLDLEDRNPEWPLESSQARRLSRDGTSIRSLNRAHTMDA